MQQILKHQQQQEALMQQALLQQQQLYHPGYHLKDEAKEDGANVDFDSQRMGKCVMLKTSTCQVYRFDYNYTLARYCQNLQSLIFDLAKEHMHELRNDQNATFKKYFCRNSMLDGSGGFVAKKWI
ncbi:uncharacterized protein LOC131219496 isoform X2 [Magnolia sinica]|uniref:uncharacterized protein LOC131219496 isoform X2 n=1 Tax=Magnolia sinica TaxID=86752 RepID=UPI0026588F66|nr:uncharacterized protein LOC131219496 isoform X2 [Magnolia sinica]